MASLTSCIPDDTLDEDLMLQHALAMSVSDAHGQETEGVGASSRGGATSSDVGTRCGADSFDSHDTADQLLQRALEASMQELGLKDEHERNESESVDTQDGSLVLRNTGNDVRGPDIAMRGILVSQKEPTQSELLKEVLEANQRASKSAKKKRKKARKLAKRNSRSSPQSLGTALKNSASRMNADELRAELRSLFVPSPWPKTQEGLQELLERVIEERAARQKKERSPIRPRKRRGSKKKKNLGASFHQRVAAQDKGGASAPSTKTDINDLDSDDLVLQQVIRASLASTTFGSNLGDSGRLMQGVRSLHKSLAMQEQIELERALEQNAEHSRRQLIFASLDPDVRKEAENIYERLEAEFKKRGGVPPSTDYVVSLAQDTIKKQVVEGEAARRAEEKALLKEQEKREEEQVRLRNLESRRVRAARLAAAAEKRMAAQKRLDSQQQQQQQQQTPG